MGSATKRKLAVQRLHDHSTVRALATVSNEVSESRILDIAANPPRRLVVPPRRRQGPTLGDLLTLNFFAEGNRQEEVGVYHETEHVPLRSLDRVPRRWWPMMLAFCLVVAGAAAGAWWLGLRPPAEWQHSRIWQTLHLPQMPPPR